MAEIIDDELLVEQFRRGDDSAFERIVEQYSADVAALASVIAAVNVFFASTHDDPSFESLPATGST